MKQNYEIVDCHCDTPGWMGKKTYCFGKYNKQAHVDLPRLREGNVRIAFFAVCTAAGELRHAPMKHALEMIKDLYFCLDTYAEDVRLVERCGLVLPEGGNGKIGCLLSLEGAEPLDGDPSLLTVFYRLGVRALSLTWNNRNAFADGVAEESSGGGLTAAGRKLVKLMEELGVILDLAHLSSRGFSDAFKLISKPPLVSHANARALCDHPRNLHDTQIKLLAEAGGVIGLSFYPPFVSATKKAGLQQLLDHFSHIADLVGVEHLAIGSDFDGITQSVDKLKDASCYRYLLEGLSKRGFSDEEVGLIAGGNVCRLINQNLQP